MRPWDLFPFNHSAIPSPLQSPRLELPSYNDPPSLIANSVGSAKGSSSKSNNDDDDSLLFPEADSYAGGSEDVEQATNCRFSSKKQGLCQPNGNHRARATEPSSPARVAKRQRRMAPVTAQSQPSLSMNRDASLNTKWANGDTDESWDAQRSLFWQTQLNSGSSVQAAQVEQGEHNERDSLDFIQLLVDDHSKEQVNMSFLEASAGAVFRGATRLFTTDTDDRFSKECLENKFKKRSAPGGSVDRKKWKYGVKRCAHSIAQYFSTNGRERAQQDELVEVLLCEEAAKLGRHRSELSVVVVKEVKRRTYDVLNILAGSGNLSRDQNHNEDKRVVKWEGHEGHRRLLEKLRGDAQTREDREREETERLERVLGEKKWILVDLRRKLWIVQRMKDLAEEHKKMQSTSARKGLSADTKSGTDCKGDENGEPRGICRPFIVFKSTSKIHIFTKDEGASKRIDVSFEGPHEVMDDWDFMESIIAFNEK